MSAARRKPKFGTKQKQRPLRHRIAEVKLGLERFAQALTGNFKLKLVFRGDMVLASHDKVTKRFVVYLPELSILERPNMTPEEVAEAEEFLVVLRGYLFHECGHVMYTDWGGNPGYIDQAKALGGGKCWELLNILEDLHIESKQAAAWRGAHEAIEVMNLFCERDVAAVMSGTHKQQATSKVPSPFRQIMYALFIVGRYGRKKAATSPLWRLLAGKARRFAKRYWRSARAAKHAQNTGEVWEITKKLWAALKLQYDPPKDEAEKKKLEEEAAKPDDPNADVPESEEPKNKPKDFKGGDPNERAAPLPLLGGDDDAADAADEKKGGVSLASDADDTDDPALKLIQTVVQAIAAAKAPTLTDQRDYLVYTTEGDTNIVPVVTADMRASYITMNETLREHYGPVKRLLENRLRAQAQVFHSPGCDEGELDTSSLFRTAFGQRNVFTQTSPSPSLLNTVCGLWFDTSASMGSGGKLWLAKQATVIFGEALDAVKIPFEVVSYTTGNSRVAETRYNASTTQDRMLYTRFGNLALTTYKTFKEPWRQSAPRIMAAFVGENTYDGECVKLACQNLLLQPQQRKVLFVMNDGEPCPNLGYKHIHDHRAYLKEVVEAMDDAGVEVVAIGIQSDAVAEYYPRHVVVNNVEELPKIMAEELGAVLLGR